MGTSNLLLWESKQNLQCVLKNTIFLSPGNQSHGSSQWVGHRELLKTRGQTLLLMTFNYHDQLEKPSKESWPKSCKCVALAG